MDGLPLEEGVGFSCLPQFKRAVQGWCKLLPQRARWPLPCSHLLLITVFLLWARKVEVALIRLVGFHTYLTPCDLSRALVSDLEHPAMTSRHFAWQAHTEELGCPSKAEQFHDGVLWDGEMGIKIGPILDVWCRSCEPSARLFNLTYVAVRHEFVGAMIALHLKKRGNWRSDKSVTRYEKAVRWQAIESEASSLQLQFALFHGLSTLDWILQPVRQSGLL